MFEVKEARRAGMKGVAKWALLTGTLSCEGSRDESHPPGVRPDRVSFRWSPVALATNVPPVVVVGDAKAGSLSAYWKYLKYQSHIPPE